MRKMFIQINYSLNGFKRRPLSWMTLLLSCLKKEKKKVKENLKFLLITGGSGKFRKMSKGRKEINEYTRPYLKL
jgi:hypothetical protein